MYQYIAIYIYICTYTTHNIYPSLAMIHLLWSTLPFTWLQPKLLGQHIGHLVEERHKHGQIQGTFFPLGLRISHLTTIWKGGWKHGRFMTKRWGIYEILRWIYGDLFIYIVYGGGITNKWVVLGRHRSFLSVPTAKHQNGSATRIYQVKQLPGLVNCHITMDRSTMLLMGKSTISMATFNSKLLVYRRVKIGKNCIWLPFTRILSHGFSKLFTENLASLIRQFSWCPPNTNT